VIEQARRAACLDGFSLHVEVRIHHHDRDGLETLCRDAARPPCRRWREVSV